MYSSVLSSSLLYLAMMSKFSVGLPQLSTQQVQQSSILPQLTTQQVQQQQQQTIAPQLSTQQTLAPQFAPQQVSTSPQLSSQLTLSSSGSTHARAILISPNGAPIFGIIDFRNLGSSAGVQVEVTVHGLDQSLPHAGHPYHIHTYGVGPDGNCEAAGGHLTPLGIPDSVPCNPSTPLLCQEGNLSGKWGLLNGSQRDVSTSFTDHQLSFNPGPSGIIGRAVVIHDAKGTRIACGNINLK